MSCDMTIDEVLAELRRKGVTASLRGSGAAEFIFAEHRGRAIELSRHHDHYWWAEFWEASDDEDAPPVKEVMSPTSADALREIANWLLN